MKNKGKLVVISGFSGAGKGTLMKALMKEYGDSYALSVSATTRKPRPGEMDGVDYFFVTKDKFEQMIAEDALIEYAQYVGNYYGTPRDYVEQDRNKGKNVILEIDVQGGLQVIEKCSDCISIFVMPPSIDELRSRLSGRGTEKEEVINKRVDEAQREIKQGRVYKYHVVNNDIETSIKEVSDILKKEMAK